MKKLTLAFVLVALMAPWAIAQNSEFNIPQVNQNSKILNNRSPLLSKDFIGLFANSSIIAGLQYLAIDASQVAHINTMGNDNTATLTQNGYNNVGIININGNGNEAGLMQNGNGLLSAINMSGNYNTLDVVQNGSALQNLILLDGNGLNFDILQNESGVQLTQTGSSIPMQIRSTGRRVPIIISSH